MSYQPRFHVVLHQPEIPPNTGAVGRTCVALEAKLWLVRPLGFQVDTKTLRRAGLDYWQHLNWEVVDHWEALRSGLQTAYANDRFWYFTKTANRLYTNVEYQFGDVLVFGCETEGLPPSLLANSPDHNLRIPIGPHVRSLNLSCSVAIAGYEAARQWSVPSID